MPGRGPRICISTSCPPYGRGTVRLLGMNDEQRLQHRQYLIARREFDVG
jgi:hypothetical protein